MTRQMAMVVMGTLGVAYALAGCVTWPHSDERQAGDSIRSFLSQYRGKVVLLLMGTEGCPGTAKASRALQAYAPVKPASVAILQLDVPLPGEDRASGVEQIDPYPRRVDVGRKVADSLDFFFYPTFYVFDQDGEMRYSGGCDEEKVNRMVKEIVAEKPGQPKVSYNLPMPKVGEHAPTFAATNLLDGLGTSLAGIKGRKATLLVFARTGCPFTIEALPSIQGIAESFLDNGVSVAVINTGEDDTKIGPIYAENMNGIPVIWDKDGSISKAYGVDVTPFFFLLDEGGKVVARRSFALQAATGTLNNLLHIAVDTPRLPPREAG